MSKIEFLNALDKELSVLSKEERREIIAFYEERFYTGTMYENRTEEEILAELESPRKIAKNVLEEYGVSKRYVKNEKERYSNVSVVKVILLIAFDVFVVTWLIPTLYGVVVSLFTALFSYVGVVPLAIGTVSKYDAYVFAFLTAGYVLMFLFALVVLEAAFYVTKKTIILHLNVFKMNKREVWIKRLSKLSVDRWFKRHRFFKTIKNLALIGAIVTIVYTGFWLFNNQEDVLAYYEYDEIQTDVYELDVSDDIAGLETWMIETDFEWMDVELTISDDDSIHVYHQYNELDDFTISIDDDTNTITVEQDYQDDWFSFNVVDAFRWFRNKKLVRIEVPSDLLIESADIKTISGDVDLDNVDLESLTIQMTNGTVSLQSISVQDDIDIFNTNGNISVRDTESSNQGVLSITNSNGRISVKRVVFDEIEIDNTNGDIIINDLNVTLQNASSVTVNTTNGRIDLLNVYAAVVTCDSTNGDIDYFNDDESFEVISFDADTTNGRVSTNTD
jgi:uncharacterized membrane protein